MANQYPEVLQEMQKAYDAWWHEMRPQMVNEGHQKMTPNPFHVKYKEQLDSGGIPLLARPQL